MLKRQKWKIKYVLTSKRKKYNLEDNCKSSQSQNSQDKSAYDSICANEILLKRNKKANRKSCAKKRKNEHKICLTSKRKKYNVQHNFDCSQSENPQDSSTYDNTQIDINKCLCK